MKKQMSVVMIKTIVVIACLGCLCGCDDEIEIKTSQIVNARNGAAEYVEIPQLRNALISASCEIIKEFDKVDDICRKWSMRGQDFETNKCFRIPMGKKAVVERFENTAIAGIILEENGDVRFQKLAGLKLMNEELGRLHSSLRLDPTNNLVVSIKNDCKGGMWFLSSRGKVKTATGYKIKLPYFVENTVEIECDKVWSAPLFKIGDYVAEKPAEQIEYQRQLMAAICSNDVRGVSQLVQNRKFDLDFEFAIGSHKWTPFEKVAAIGNVEMAEVLVSAGARTNYDELDRYSPLDQAAYSGRLDMVKYLSGHDYFFLSNLSAPLWAARAGQLEVLKWMIEMKEETEASPDLDFVIEEMSATGALLAEAASKGQIEVCKYLITKGATIDYKPKSSNGGYYYSALERAAQNGQMEVVRYLVEEKGAKLFDALDLARKNKHEQVVKYLEQHYVAELKARKEAAEVAERKKIEAEKRRRGELVARKEKEDRVLSEYRKLTSSLGWFSGEHGYSEGAEKWARGLVKGLNVINQKHFDESVKSAFRIMVAKADVLLTEVRNEQDMRREISEAKVKLQDQISQNGEDTLGNMWAAGSQGLCGGKREALSGLMNYFGALSQGVNNEKKLKNVLAELERLEEHSHDKVSRAYADYKDAAEIFEKRALRQVNE